MNREIGGILKKAAIIIIALSMILSLGGCVRISTAWHDLTRSFGIDEPENIATARRLNEVEMIKLLTGAVRGDQELTTFYNSVSLRQLNGLTQDEFHQYIRLLRRGISGDIHSFTVMDDNELIENKAVMTAALPDQKELIDSSIAYWIIYRQSGRSDERFAVYMQLDEDGQVYLSAAWIRQILQLSGYANLYFDALDKSDSEALAFLISQDETDKRVIEAKSDFLVKFYQNNISSRTSEYSLNMARIDSISYEQFGIINPDQTQSVSRTVAFRIDNSGVLRVDDNVMNVLAREDMKILLNGEPLFTIAARSNDTFERVWSYRLEQATGLPFVHDDSNCKPYVDGVDLINLSYNGISISAQGDCQDHDSWNGIIRSLSIINGMYHTGGGLRPGQPVEELLIKYPFAEQSGYQLKTLVEGGIVTMTVTIEDDIIKKIDYNFLQTEQ